MQVIVQGQDDIVKLWGEPNPKDGVSYRNIQYMIRDDTEEGTLLLNTITGELVLLNTSETAIMNSSPVPCGSTIVELVKHHFLVPEEFDELKSIDQLRNLLKLLARRDDIKGYTILPTTGCNARCFYCFESADPHHTMSVETATKVVDFIKANCSNKKEIGIKWFGGEPTLGEDKIDLICDLLMAEGIKYTSTMISNAYLFTPQMAKKAKEKWKLTSVQITLDGTEDVYNAVKSYVNAKDNPFQRVMENIGYLLDERIKVNVRMNLDFHNITDLETLISELGNRFAGRELFTAYTSVLFEDCGTKPVKHSQEERESLAAASVRLNNLIEEVGCKKSSRFGIDGKLPCLGPYFCMADNPSAILINPIGQIGKCEHEIYQHLCGNVVAGYDMEKAERWLSPYRQEGCKCCPLYPRCGLVTTCTSKEPCLQSEIRELTDDVKKQMRYRLRELRKSDYKEVRNDGQA